MFGSALSCNCLQLVCSSFLIKCLNCFSSQTEKNKQTKKTLRLCNNLSYGLDKLLKIVTSELTKIIRFEQMLGNKAGKYSNNSVWYPIPALDELFEV